MNIKQKKGFTIIEVTMSILIMTIGIVGIYYLTPRIISVMAVNKSRFIAAQLAREGMEIARNFRDTNWIEEEDWREGFTGCLSGCSADYKDTEFSSYGARELRINSSGFYNYDSGENSGYKRKITMSSSPNYMEITVSVLWDGKGSPLEIKERLYNWY